MARVRDGALVVDVREPAEWSAGHVAGAVLLPLGEMRGRIGDVVPDHDVPIVLHCAVGARSARAAAWLAELGHRDVVNLRAPIDGWAAAGGAWETPDELPPEQRRRYARQLLVPEIGPAGQRALLEASVLLAGGLGSPAALYLAAAGIGTIGVVDDDVVDESNLDRQVLHATDRIGSRKVDSAEQTLRGLNPSTAVVKHDERLDADSAERLIGGYDPWSTAATASRRGT